MSDIDPTDTHVAAPFVVDPISVHTAPVVFFDQIPTFGVNNGVVSMMLTLSVFVPAESGEARVETKHRAVGHIRCSPAAAVALRDTLDRALLLAAETKGGKQ
jgi:hypothetical protein